MQGLLDKKLFLIFLLALFFRIFSLGSVPFGFHNDEVDVGYVGKFILLNGRDPSGAVLPLAFNKFGDYRPTGLFYLAGISELAFGTNEFASRLPAAVFGALSIYPLFFIALKLFGNRKSAYFSALSLAVLPWDIVLSRSGHEAIVGYFFILCGLYFAFRYSETLKRSFLIWSGALFLVSYFFYHGTRFLVPILLGTTIVVLGSRRLVKLTIIMSVVTLLILISPIGKGRLSQVVFYKDPGLVKKLQELPFADVGDIGGARVFHNKAVVYPRQFIGNYLQYFSPDFLFLRGGYPERYIVPEVGAMLYVFILPFLLGLALLLRKSRREMLVLAWLFASPVVSVLTYEDIPSATRASFMIFPLVLIIGYGMDGALGFVKGYIRYLVIAVFGVLLIAEMAFFWHEFANHQKYYKAIFRDDGAKEAMQYLTSQKGSYDLVVAPFRPNYPFYYLFFNNIFDKNIRLDISDLSKNFQQGNVLFVQGGICATQSAGDYTGKKVLFLDEENCGQREGLREVYKISRADGTISFRAFSN